MSFDGTIYTTAIDDETHYLDIQLAYERDKADTYYRYDPDTDQPEDKAIKAERLAGLEDVVFATSDRTLVVRDVSGLFIGKIELYPNDCDKTLNCMYLYMSGDRRRRIGKQAVRCNLHGAHLMWYFVAREALRRYGEDASILVTYPRKTVLKYVIMLGGVFVPLRMDGEKAIESSVAKSLVTHEYHIDAYDKMASESGAFFRALLLTKMIESLERGYCDLR